MKEEAAKSESQSSSGANDKVSGIFRTTQWTVVSEAAAANATALDQLCRTYWPAVYVICKQRLNGEDAKDATQAFFAHILSNAFLQRVQEDKGSFRSYLRMSLSHFLDSEYRRNRGRERYEEIVPSGWFEQEDKLDGEQPLHQQPDRAYDLKWARSLFNSALAQMEHEYEREGNLARFKRYEPFLRDEHRAGQRAEVASELGIKPDSVSMELGRMKQDLWRILCLQASRTVVDHSRVEIELHELFPGLKQRLKSKSPANATRQAS